MVTFQTGSGTAPSGELYDLGTSGAVFVPEIWATETIHERDHNFLVTNYTKKIPFMGRAGDTIKYPRIGRLGVQTKVPGAPIVYQSRSETEWTMVIDQYKAHGIAIDDVLRIQSHTDLRSAYSKELGYAQALDMEYATLGMRAALNGYSNASHINSGGHLTYADILSAKEILDSRRVPREGRVIIIGVEQQAAIFADSLFVKTDFNSGNTANIASGNIIATVLGMPVMVSNLISTNSATGLTFGESLVDAPTPGFTGSEYYPTQFADQDERYDLTPTSLPTGKVTGMMVHPEWCACAWQKMPSLESEWDMDYQVDKVVSTWLYGLKLYRPDHGVLLSTTESGALSNPS